MRTPLVIVLFFLLPIFTFAQEAPKKTRKHPPKAATIMSACLPGLGQVYNRKYWKVPIIYAGLGTTAYFFNYTNTQFKTFREAYKFRTDTIVSTIDELPEYSSEQLKTNMNFYRRYRDLNVVLFVMLYTLNIVDANVDAHLFTYDVSDDLSMNWSPKIYAYNKKTLPGLQLTFRLK